MSKLILTGSLADAEKYAEEKGARLFKTGADIPEMLEAVSNGETAVAPYQDFIAGYRLPHGVIVVLDDSFPEDTATRAQAMSRQYFGLDLHPQTGSRAFRPDQQAGAEKIDVKFVGTGDEIGKRLRDILSRKLPVDLPKDYTIPSRNQDIEPVRLDEPPIKPVRSASDFKPELLGITATKYVQDPFDTPKVEDPENDRSASPSEEPS